ncbi:MAG: LysM peptidoglycan-binding domain-containing protein [Chloroflexi bacterium]|nr:LysM peptidoglycan-binding domain-containing protein [Chloroflexota bacterium]
MKRYLVAFILMTALAITTAQTAWAAPPSQGGGQVHYVRAGESLYGIAAQYGVSAEAIMRQNGVVNPDMIYAGQPLMIPLGAYGGPAGHADWGYGCGNSYTVTMGDTLSGIAWRFGTSARELMRLNNLYNENFVYVGQRLCIPSGGGYSNYNPAPAVYYHTVASGETLSNICDRYGVNQWHVIQANQLSNAAYIWPGQRLAIPGYQPAPPVAYAPPPVYAPPPAMPYPSDTYDSNLKPPSYKQPVNDGKLPTAPDYQKGAARPLLPLAEHPIEVVINGGETWADETNSGPDPNNITTVVVQTGPEFGKTVRMRSGDYEVKGETQYLSGEFGPSSLAFRYVPPGDYDVWVDDPDTPSEKVQISLDPGQRVNVAFSKQVRFQGQTYASPDGWFLSAWENPSKPHQNIGAWSNILVKTPASGLTMVAESEGGGYKATCLTGAKGPGACDFAGLNAGFYFIKIDGTQLTVKIYMDGNAYAVLEFAKQPTKDDSNFVGPVNYD